MIWVFVIMMMLFLVIFLVVMGCGGCVVLGVNFVMFVVFGFIVMGMM